MRFCAACHTRISARPTAPVRGRQDSIRSIGEMYVEATRETVATSTTFRWRRSPTLWPSSPNSGGGMNEDELKRQALALFGGKRLTDGVSSRLDAGLQRGLETGRLERDDRGLFQAVDLS